MLDHIREGRSNKEIAQRLDISIDGVKFHVSEILSKLALENRWDAARWAASGGEEAHPWWLAATAPLLFWRKLSFDWLSPALAGGLAVATAAGVGLLVWALITTRGDGDRASMAVSVALALPAGDKIAYIAGPPATPEANAAPRAGDLWLIEAGRSPRRFTEGGDAHSPVWSPDGRGLLFFMGDELTLMESDGTLRSIETAVVSARWSPQGDRIAYWLEGRMELPDGEEGVSTWGEVWAYDVASGEKERLLPEDFLVHDLAWSPNGRELALARYIQPVFEPPSELPNIRLSPDATLWLLTFKEDGSTDLRRLFSREEIAEALPEMLRALNLGPTGVTDVTWSADGEWLGFRATSLSASLAADGLPFLTVRREGTDLAYHGIMLRSPALRDWAPEGHTLAITLGGGRDVSMYKTIAIVAAGVPGVGVVGEDPTRYETTVAAGTPTPVSARSDAAPAWSPDGTRIAFQASEAGFPNLNSGKVEGPKEGIWVVDANGANLRQLTSDPDYLDFYPRWSADGDLILFIRTTPDRAELWAMRPDGSEAKRLVSDLLRIGSYYGLFTWDELLAWHRAPANP